MTKQNKNVNKSNNKANEILQNVCILTKGLLKTNLGTKKTSVYKEEIFTGMNDRDKKSLRKKFRNTLFSIAKSLISETNKENQEKLIKAFNAFYNETYQVNDYSLQSVCNENLANEKKEILIKCLDICKK